MIRRKAFPAAIVRLVLGLAVVALFCGARPILAQGYSFVVDVPATLGGTDFTSIDSIRTDGAGTYTLEQSLPVLGQGAKIDAMEWMDDATLLFSSDIPFTFGASQFNPQDVVQYDPSTSTYSLFWSANSAGLSSLANIDAVAWDKAGYLLVSFDTPVTVNSLTYHPTDVARVLTTTTLSRVFDGIAHGLPERARMSSLEFDGTNTYRFTIDIPLNNGGYDYPTGTILEAQGGGATYSLWHQDPNFPVRGAMTALSFQGAPGNVPDGSVVPGTPLVISKSAGDITLSWGSSCAGAADDYEVYEGTLGNFASHASRLCTTGGVTAVSITPSSGARYYLVVPRNNDFEGGYGYDSSGTARPPAASPCVASNEESCP